MSSVLSVWEAATAGALSCLAHPTRHLRARGWCRAAGTGHLRPPALCTFLVALLRPWGLRESESPARKWSRRGRQGGSPVYPDLWGRQASAEHMRGWSPRAELGLLLPPARTPGPQPGPRPRGSRSPRLKRSASSQKALCCWVSSSSFCRADSRPWAASRSRLREMAASRHLVSSWICSLRNSIVFAMCTRPSVLSRRSCGRGTGRQGGPSWGGARPRVGRPRAASWPHTSLRAEHRRSSSPLSLPCLPLRWGPCGPSWGRGEADTESTRKALRTY